MNMRGTVLYGDDPVTKYISIFFLSRVNFIILCYFSVNLIIPIISFLV